MGLKNDQLIANRLVPFFTNSGFFAKFAFYAANNRFNRSTTTIVIVLTISDVCIV